MPLLGSTGGAVYRRIVGGDTRSSRVGWGGPMAMPGVLRGSPGRGIREGGWQGPQGLFRVPVGIGVDPVFAESQPVPPVVSVIAPDETTDIPTEIDRRDQPPNETELPTVLTDAEWLVRMGLPPAQPIYQSIQPVGVPVRVTEPQGIVEPEEEDDVGLLSDIYTTVDETVFGGVLPGGADFTWGTPQPQVLQPGPIYAQQPAPPGLPAPGTMPPVGMGSGCGNPYAGWVWKFHCGQWKWIKQNRKRKSKLVSQSDAQGLSTLISILGNGKATQAWIATHS